MEKQQARKSKELTSAETLRATELFRFVRDYVKKHKIANSEMIFQNGELHFGAPDFMDQCVRFTGFYKSEGKNE